MLDDVACPGGKPEAGYDAGRSKDSARRRSIQGRLHAPDRHRFELHCARAWDCGPRVLAALLDELAVRHGLGPAIDDLLEAYAELDPGLIRRLGADQFAERGLMSVPAVAA
jgi:hypothetical protein